jgi:hypothetical protein
MGSPNSMDTALGSCVKGLGFRVLGEENKSRESSAETRRKGHSLLAGWLFNGEFWI